jgi:hypothetical protein
VSNRRSVLSLVDGQTGDRSTDDDRAGLNDGKPAVGASLDASNDRFGATNQQASSTWLTPLQAKYHKYVAASSPPVASYGRNPAGAPARLKPPGRQRRRRLGSALRLSAKGRSFD